jgi:Photosynthesis affected mutant 68
MNFFLPGLAIFVGAFFYSKKYDVVVPPSIIAYATQVPFVLGLMGISYAIISTSWDEVNHYDVLILGPRHPRLMLIFYFRINILCDLRIS